MKALVPNLDVYLTGACNFRCDYCYGEDDACGHMPGGVYDAALGFGRHVGASNIQMCGGEPLMNPAFEDYVSRARVAGFDVILRTNGMLLGPHLEFVAKNCAWVGVSLDGLADANAAMRTPRAATTDEEQFETPVANIRALKHLNPDIKIILATLASRKNADAIPAFADWIVRTHLPIDRWKIYEFIADKFRSGAHRREFEMTAEAFSEMVARLPDEVNGAPVIAQSAHTDRVAANCLIVYQGGDVKLLGKNYGNVLRTPFAEIVSALEADRALGVVEANKNLTYN